jgi:hypothetical protein
MPLTREKTDRCERALGIVIVGDILEDLEYNLVGEVDWLSDPCSDFACIVGHLSRASICILNVLALVLVKIKLDLGQVVRHLNLPITGLIQRHDV